MNRESIKAVLGFMLLVCVAAGLGVFIVPELQRSIWKWIIAMGSGGLALAAVVVLVRLHFQADLAPDFLSRQAGTFFDRAGFCFSFTPTSENGVCVLQILFQNRYDRPVEARVALRPARELFMRADIPIIGIDIACPPAGFGVAKLPFPVPAKYQGSKQKFDVGADARYPQGKGRMLRFRSGLHLGAGTSFSSPFGAGLTAAGMVAGAIVISYPASLTFRLPTGVAETPLNPAVAIEVLWKLGDPVSTSGAS